MFPLSELKNLDLQKAGLKLTPQELYNPQGVSMIDAIVRVGGCTGSFISDEGLIVTNHHCAFGFVQAISSTKQDYIKYGFLAKDKAGEVPAKGLVCKITASYEDVSARVLQGTQELDPVARLKAIAANIRQTIDAENKANPGLQCEISEMFTGKTYVLFRYKLLKDVRLVYVPASSIGEYGGEKDNWVWPRHSGDFAFLRAYVAPDGSAAEYSDKNVPYKPVKFLKVNPKGVNENDFIFILGYPGRTYRHQPAGFYAYHEKYLLSYISNLFDWQINQMEELGSDNYELKIRYAAKIKSLANTAKNFKGKLQGFRRANLLDKKKEEEQKLQQFIEADASLKKQYGAVLPRINTLYEELMAVAPRNMWLDQVYNVSPLMAASAVLANYQDQYNQIRSGAEKKAYLAKEGSKIKSAVARFTNQLDVNLDKTVLKKMLADASLFDKQNRLKAVQDLTKGKTTLADIDMLAEKLYASSKLKDTALMRKLGDEPEKMMQLKDPLISFVRELNVEMAVYDAEDQKRDGELSMLMSKLVDVKQLWQNRSFVPDANATLRFTYGYVKGYQPNDGEYHKPFTTLGGVIEKADTNEYQLLDVIRELYAARAFGDYYSPVLGDLPVDILYNLDTTGGNSGSPVMNDKGELVAINFDRAFTATINDYAWNETYSRSVGVDIRYVLWVLQKVAKADHIINEMSMVRQ